jgi:hypothetical protein
MSDEIYAEIETATDIDKCLAVDAALTTVPDAKIDRPTGQKLTLYEQMSVISRINQIRQTLHTTPV